MAVGLNEPDAVLPVAGVKLASVSAGIKNNGNDDLVLFVFDDAVNCAASFTKNAFCAAPVVLARQHLSKINSTDLSLRALLINSGNANAGTGDKGLNNAIQSCAWLAEKLAAENQPCTDEQILPFSTGIIGEQLPMSAFESGINKITRQLAEDNWLQAAKGIMTTDTVAKAVSSTVILDGETITISGIAKGSGMICPNMATMLAFIATDANVHADFLQQCLSEVVNNSFNTITVDGDTSTNDACVLIASGKANNQILTRQSAQAAVFIEAIQSVCQHLAQSIVRDAEGATKFVTVRVEQSQSVQEARDIAYTIAHSPLVKTALFASDPNWGRILAAVGRGGIEQLDISQVNLYLGDVCIVRSGGVAADYTEEQGQAVMNRSEITIRVELGRGESVATIWTSDLSHEYVRINAEYRS